MIVDWVLDLDNCLYPYDNGLYRHINYRMNTYIAQKLTLPYLEVDALRKQFIEKYGNTLLGLIIHHQVNAHDFLQNVHDIDLTQFVNRDDQLKDFLQHHVQGNLYIFTNAPGFYARKILQILGIDHMIKRVFDIYFTDFRGKPHNSAYKKVILHTGIIPKNTLFVDDMIENVVSAKAMGFQSVHIDTSIPYKNNYYIDLFIPKVQHILKSEDI